MSEKKLFVSNKDESVRMFKSDFLDIFSRVHWSVPLITWVPIVLYSLYRAVFIYHGNILIVSGVFIIGLSLWTLAEYTLHRFIFHFEPTSAIGQRIHFLTHGVHHDYPNDSKRLVMPPLLSIPLAIPFMLLFYYGLDKAAISFASFAGFITGYLIYDMMHYALHHVNFDSELMKDLKNHHMLHHYYEPENGFGVSTKFWDLVFRTTFKKIKKNKTIS